MQAGGSRRRRRFTLTAILAAVLVAVTTATAEASSLLYVKGGDVWIASAAGKDKRRVTTAGTARKPYTLAGASDSGKIVAARGSSTPTWFMYDPGGSLRNEGPNIVPMRNCGFPSVGPISPRLHPGGKLAAFWYFCNSIGGTTPRLSVDNPDTYTAGGNSAELGTYWYDPSWFGKRLVVSDGQKIFVQNAGKNAPFVTGFTVWLLPPEGASLDRAEIARKARRFVLEVSAGGPSEIQLYTYSGTPPAGDIKQKCSIDAAGDPSDGTLSPDGKRVAWHDRDGVKVARVDLSRPSCVARGSTRLVASGADQPRFAGYTLDTKPPATRITDGPASTTSSRKARFRFRASEPASFRCKLDRKAWKPCSSPKTYKGLARGSHTFRVEARDRAGNTDGTPAVRTWRIT